MDRSSEGACRSIKIEQTNSDEEDEKHRTNLHESQFCDTSFAGRLEVMGNKTMQPVPINTYKLNDLVVVTLPDVYEAVRNACGSCSSVQGTMGKLGIVANRFTPTELTRLKQLQAVNPGAKCCSYIFIEEFRQLLARLDSHHGHNCKEFIQIAPATVLDTPGHPAEAVFTESRSAVQNKSSNQPSFSHAMPEMPRIHTFMLNEQVIVDYSQLKTSFELLFRNSISFDECIAQLAINSIAYSKDGNAASIRLFVAQRDAHRMFQYAGALTNVDTTNVKWIKPRKLSNVEVTESSSHKNTVRDESPPEYHVLSYGGGSQLDVSHSDNRQVFFSVPETGKEVNFDNELKDSPSIAMKNTNNFPEKRGVSEPEFSISCDHEHKDNIWRDSKLSRKISQDLESGDIAGPTNYQTADESEVETAAVQDDNNISSVTLSTACDDEEQDYTGSSLTVRTFQINGEVVVCIPDIHKAIISLYGQSVQVGYYMHRLNIVTRRFSHAHVKQLKQHDVLSLKATVCTYISKSDAQKLIKMYDAINTICKNECVNWAEPIELEDLFFEQSQECSRDEANFPESESACPFDVSPGFVKIPTFIIEGAVVVSMPDAHKAVQILNGQSVQLRYNLEKLGIVKRKYTYSQVYQLKAFSDIKRPSMCTFILKSDVERLLRLYLTPEKVPRLNCIEWLPPVALEDLNQVQGSHGEAINHEHKPEASSVLSEPTEQEKPQKDEAQVVIGQEQSLSADDENFRLNLLSTNHDARKSSTVDQSHRESEPSLCTTVTSLGNNSESASLRLVGTPANQGSSSAAHVLHQHISHVTGRPQRADISTVHGHSLPVESIHSQRTNRISSPCMQIVAEQGSSRSADVVCYSQKRLLEVSSEKEQLEASAKKLKADNEEHVKTVQRKETEMKILHDAYQHEIELEREKREKAEKEAADLRTSNQELLKNLQRKESEMKILHDSYQLQILHEKEKREHVEKQLNEILGTRGKDLTITDMKKEQL